MTALQRLKARHNLRRAIRNQLWKQYEVELQKLYADAVKRP